MRIDLEAAFGSVPPAITSASATTFTVGQFGSFTVTTTGTPPVTTITRGGVALPGGVGYVDNGDGTATLSGTPNAGTNGSYVFTFTASNGVPPDAVQDPFTLTINKQAQTISFTSSAPAGAVVGGPTYTVTATASSGLPVAFTIDASASTVCSIAGSTVSFIGAGTCVIDANQPGDGTYSPAPQAQQSFAVSKVSQTISFTSSAPAAAVVGGPTYTVTATASSGLPVAFTIDATATSVCSIAGSTVSFSGVGTCVIDANQPGDGTYDPAPQAQQSFAVGKGSQTITFTSSAPSAASVGGPTYTVTAIASSGLPVAFTIDGTAASVCSISGSTVSFIGNGTCVIDANQAGNANYDPAPPAQQSFAVKSPQTISFTSVAPTNAVVGGPTYTVTAAATSGLPVALSIDASASTVCSIAGSTVSFISAGTCVIDANQAGDGSYLPAAQVQQSFTVKNTQTISFTSAPPAAAVYQGPPYNVTASATSGLPVALSIDASASTVCSIAGSTVSFIGTGTCTINANQAGDASYASAPQVQQSFAVGPNLVGDSYSALGNTQLVAAGQSAPSTPFTTDPTTILANDTSDVAITLTTVTGAATTGGGSITIAADGSFTYAPPVGQSSGTDTYAYTGTSNGVSRTATITFNISQIVWYVDNSSGGAHDGSSTDPFLNMGSGAGNLGSALSNAGPAAGAHIYVYKGSGTTAGAYTFKANQTLIGAGATLSVGGLTIAGNAANTPTLGGTLTLANNVTINGIDMSTGASNGLVGTSVTGLSVTVRNLTAITGTPVNIGGAGNNGTFLFRSISANGGANGIVLQNMTGSFTVTGDGTNTALGGNASGGTIANMTGADGGNSGTGVYMNSVQNVTLRRMTINGTNQNFGIRGVSVTNFTMEYSTVSGVNGTSTPNREGAVIFDNLFGASAITSSIISGAIEDNLRVENTTGTLTAFNLTNSTIQNNSTVSGNVGFRFATATPGVSMTGTVSGSTFQGNRTIAIQADASNGTVNFTASNNTIIAGTGGNNQGNQGIEVDVANNGVMTFSVSGNKIGTPDGVATAALLNTGINIFNGTLVVPSASISGTVTNNIVFNDPAAVAGSSNGFGIRLFNQGFGTMNADVSGNTVKNINTDYGIFAEVSSNSGNAAAAGSSSIGMTNNTANVNSGALDAIRLQARGNSTMCARISGNASATAGMGFVGLEIRQANQVIPAGGTTYTPTFNLEGLTAGLQTNHATIVSYLSAQNPAITDGTDEIHVTGITGVATGACTQIP